MATASLIPISEYLDTVYRPDREYIDGEIRERNVGKYEHARLQLVLGAWFYMHEKSWNVMSSTDQRVQVSPNRVRIPDLVVLLRVEHPAILVEPPILAIEILSPADTYSDLQERCQDYVDMGVANVWIVDPQTRSGRMCSGSEWIAATRLEVSGTPIYVELTDLFAQIGPQSSPLTLGE